MGQIHSPKPVLPLVAVTTRYDDAFGWTKQRLEKEMGNVDLESDIFQFDQTDYYEASMGTNLKKRFFIPGTLVDPSILPTWKNTTNQWEVEFKQQSQHNEQRPLNLDPGYISEDKLVLASTKNHAHRIYLTDGIYAEVTLQFRQKQWQSCLWTYPDYATQEYLRFFDRCRDHLRSQLRHHA